MINVTLRIDPEQKEIYVKREANKKFKYYIISTTIFTLLMFLFESSYNVKSLNLTLTLGTLFLFIGFIFYYSARGQIRELITLTEFQINDDKISKYLNKENLNLINKIGVAKNESKFGVKYNETIDLKLIESTEIRDDEIVFKSKNENLLNGNGNITIPKEFENYELIKNEILKNSHKYKLKEL